MKFYKMTRSGTSLMINSKRYFSTGIELDFYYYKKAFDFSYDMTFGNQGEHRNHRSGGIHQRKNGEIFCDTLQGKISEFAIYQIFKEKFYIPEPDTQCFKLGKWDQFDFSIKDKVISVKSTKDFGNLLLLETRDWNEYGEYIPNNNEPIDYTFLVRIKDRITSTLKANRLYYTNQIDKAQLWNLLSDIIIVFDIPGFITQEDLIYLIRNNFVIRQGEYLNGTTRMDADNYYCQTGNLRKLEEFFEVEE